MYKNDIYGLERHLPEGLAEEDGKLNSMCSRSPFAILLKLTSDRSDSTSANRVYSVFLNCLSVEL